MAGTWPSDHVVGTWTKGPRGRHVTQGPRGRHVTPGTTWQTRDPGTTWQASDPWDFVAGTGPRDYVAGTWPRDYVAGTWPRDYVAGTWPRDHVAGTWSRENNETWTQHMAIPPPHLIWLYLPSWYTNNAGLCHISDMGTFSKQVQKYINGYISRKIPYCKTLRQVQDVLIRIPDDFTLHFDSDPEPDHSNLSLNLYNLIMIATFGLGQLHFWC